MVLGAVIGAAVLIPLGWFALRQLSRVGHQPLSNARAVVWATGWEIFSSHPIIGAGPGAYPVLSPAITATPPGYDANHAHDLWLQVAAEEGLIGEILLLAALGLILLPGLRALKKAEASDASIAAYLGVAASLLAHQVVDYMFGVVLYALAAVCLLAIYLHTFKGRTLSLNRGSLRCLRSLVGARQSAVLGWGPSRTARRLGLGRQRFVPRPPRCSRQLSVRV
jgi:O-antigen ligase